MLDLLLILASATLGFLGGLATALATFDEYVRTRRGTPAGVVNRVTEAGIKRCDCSAQLTLFEQVALSKPDALVNWNRGAKPKPPLH